MMEEPEQPEGEAPEEETPEGAPTEDTPVAEGRPTWRRPVPRSRVWRNWPRRGGQGLTPEGSRPLSYAGRGGCA